MFLCDIGNTSYHFLHKNLDYKESVETFNPQTIQEKIYYICVNPNIIKVLAELDNWIDLAQYTDMKNYYETMGIDRIVACEAISDGVIVDAGSAITVDLVKSGVFQGGFIYPGSRAMGKAYSNISPALEYEFNYQLDLQSLPKNSRDAISYGYLKMLHTEVVSQNESIYLIGGDAHKLLHIFPNAEINQNLIFDGMKKILKQVN
ncbi:MAG: type III pantothenate kinase [Sulfurimonas sp.]|jgi:type III pantothenate kinase|uniref:type III pantothenate kinase n=1 Tax=Sulfurimonas sp. TaxID=2022749 RepID=UPI0039E4AC4B